MMNEEGNHRAERTPRTVHLVSWLGDTSQLAVRLRIRESDLVASLNRLALRDYRSTRLVIAAPLANENWVLAALQRRLLREIEQR